MAEREVNLDEGQEGEQEQEPGKGGGRKWLVLILLLLIVAGGAGAGAWFFLLGDEAGEEEAEAGPPQRFYHGMEPMTVNIEGPGRIQYLRVELGLVTHDPEVIDAVQTHLPAVRNDVLGLLAEQRYEDLNTREGKDALAEALREAIRTTLRQREAPDSVEAVLFHELVMQ
ncbi:MAG: flagellar basal body-associated FliL family protein [Pseudomonadota bacterium]